MNEMPNINQNNDQESFFTGLSNQQGTKTGFQVANNNYNVKFEAIQCENLPADVLQYARQIFQSCYNWKNVMEMILECLENYNDEEDFQTDLKYSIKAWIREYGGWGMCFTLIPVEFQSILMDVYTNLTSKYQERNIEKSNKEIFTDMMEIYENETQALPLSNIVPKVEARIQNIVSGPEENERKKSLIVRFLSSKCKLIANFTVEKKRLRRNLVESTAEVIGKIVENSKNLEIPLTLKTEVDKKILDTDWVNSYWNEKNRQQNVI